MKRLRLIGICSLGIFSVAGFRLAYSFHRYHVAESKFGQIHEGQSCESVLSLLGTPNYHSGECRRDLILPPGCKKQLVYSHPFAPLIPEYHVISFSSDDRVIDASEIDSP